VKRQIADGESIALIVEEIESFIGQSRSKKKSGLPEKVRQLRLLSERAQENTVESTFVFHGKGRK
jgi:hypothetical protein